MLEYLPIGEHTLKKYEVYRTVFPIWVEKMKSASSSVYYIDLTAGPGLSKVEETGLVVEGSPMIALDTHPPFAKLTFVEKVPERSRVLRLRLSQHINQGFCAVFNEDSCRIEVIATYCREFLEGFDELPCLVCIDPDGPSDVSWSLYEYWLRRSNCDLILTYPPPLTQRSWGKYSGRYYVRGYHRALPKNCWEISPSTNDNISVELIKCSEETIRSYGCYVVRLRVVQGPVGNILYAILFVTHNRQLAQEIDEIAGNKCWGRKL
jgi:three-Cys-motif partner protein